MLVNTQNGVSMTWEGPVHSIRKPYEEIMDEGLCLSVSTHTIKALRKEGGSRKRSYWDATFEIEVKNKSSESHSMPSLYAYAQHTCGLI